MFQRIDRDLDGFIQPLDILKFLRENDSYSFNEANCFYLVKFFDSDEDGQLSYAEFLQFVLPCENSLLRAFATQKSSNTRIKKVGDLLPDTIEKELASLLVMELDLHR